VHHVGSFVWSIFGTVEEILLDYFSHLTLLWSALFYWTDFQAATVNGFMNWTWRTDCCTWRASRYFECRSDTQWYW